MDKFELYKKNCLSKIDKSKAGEIDQKIKELCELINSEENYYTTSSCSGRIVLRKESSSGKKNECEWLLVSHEKIKDVNLKDLPKEDTWLVMEAPIMHICCKTVEDAQKLLDMFRNEGFKRSGIIGIKDKIMVEIIGTEHLDVLVSRNEKLLVSQDYLKLIIEEANKKLEQSWKKIEKIKDKIKIKKFIL